MHLNTDHFERCIKTLESSLLLHAGTDPESIDYEIFRNPVVEGFELTLETGGKLLRKALKAYSGSPREVDGLEFPPGDREGGVVLVQDGGEATGAEKTGH